MKLLAAATLYANSTSDSTATPAGTSGELARTEAAAVETMRLTRARGGEFTATTLRITMPDAIATDAAAMGITKASSDTAWPNQVDRMPATAR